jgi:hypothetical protein
MQLHSANDQMTAHVNMAFSRPQNYDSLHHVLYLEAFVIVPYNSGYSHRWLQDSTCALAH